MNILVAMTQYPCPPRVGSTIVAYNTIKRLSSRHRVELICFEPNDRDITTDESISRLELVPKKNRSWLSKWTRYLTSMTVGVPSLVSGFHSVAMKVRVQKVLQSREFDAILLFELGAIQYFRRSHFNKIVVNIEDPQSLKQGRLLDLPVWSWWQRTKLILLTRLTAIYERRLLPQMGRVLLLSEADVNDMRAQGNFNNVACIPYGVEQRSSTEIRPFEDRLRVVVFSGSMYHPPNVDGALYLLRDISPEIQRRSPQTVLWIVGAKPDHRIQEAAAPFGRNVVVTGEVEDISQYIKQAAVSVCPVRLKIGVQTKILEAMSWGTPVVTTSAGNRGVSGIPGHHLCVEDDASRFAHAVTELLQGGARWSELSNNGRRLVAEWHAWEASVTRLERHLEKVAKVAQS